MEIQARGGRLGSPDDPERKKTDVYQDLANERLRALREHQEYAAYLGNMRSKVNTQSGTVAYLVNGTAKLIDRGKFLTVLTNDAIDTKLGLEMAIHKYGSTLNVTGTEVWKQHLVREAAKMHVNVTFTDIQLQQQYVTLLNNFRAPVLSHTKERGIEI